MGTCVSSRVLNKKEPQVSNSCNSLIFKLSCQGSNLDSSDPESDVLPVTPQDSIKS